MGAAAVLKAVGEHRLQPAALVLECPFDRFAATVRHRFRAFGIPAFPAADLLLFWGGVQQGFNPWRFNPADYAAGVRAPTLLMNGGKDPWVSEAEARTIFDHLRGPKRLHLFPELGHQSFLQARRTQWVRAVGEFLAAHAASARPGT
jgi:alpha-beta hydrolase superfamily lysophospholipase